MTLFEVLAEVMPAEADEDGAVTVRHDGTVASLREVSIAEGLEITTLTQVLAFDLPLNAALRDAVAAHANATMLGTVTLVERPHRRADVMLRYNFPAAGLSDAALQTLVLLALEGGAEVSRALSG